MIFLNYSFFGDSTSILPTPTAIDDITYVELQNGVYDDLYITKDADDTSSIIKDEWDFDTILHATFNDVTDAGNVTWNLNNTSGLLVKRREIGDSKWMTIAEYPINSIEDFNFIGFDAYARSQATYQYAIVPVLGNVEGNYCITTVESKFNGIYLVEKDLIYGTFLTDDLVNTTRNVPSSILDIPANKYPTYCSNSIANYDTGSCSGTFAYLDTETCQFDFEHIYSQTEKVMERLANRKPKILKVHDGRIWLIMVTGNPTDTGDTYIYNRIIAFEWAEIGDYKSEKALYWAGLSDVSSQWWNT